ncbi:MAG TPA: DUF1841 family protein [Usitatibacter sp.]|nr:DUF1841 family protein [Usitatibacter sp.]HST01681.1 DUF1841 family protein [Usitatibacter sp.]
MFNPSRDQSRVFLFDLWQKHRDREPLTPLEAMALDIVLEHPEYHRVLDDRERYLDRDWKPEGGETNPFLHLAMHLAIAEQLSIDQPPGIRAAVDKLATRRGSMHDARHDVMECLAEMIWQAQRHGSGFDNATYLECVERKTR